MASISIVRLPRAAVRRRSRVIYINAALVFLQVTSAAMAFIKNAAAGRTAVLAKVTAQATTKDVAAGKLPLLSTTKATSSSKPGSTFALSVLARAIAQGSAKLTNGAYALKATATTKAQSYAKLPFAGLYALAARSTAQASAKDNVTFPARLAAKAVAQARLKLTNAAYALKLTAQVTAHARSRTPSTLTGVFLLFGSMALAAARAATPTLRLPLSVKVQARSQAQSKFRSAATRVWAFFIS